MKRVAACLCLLACAGAAPAGARAASGTITGRITEIGASTLTVQTPGPRIGVINALTRSADALTAGDYPYVWGGGHAQAGTASVGERGGPGYNGHRRGFDCSGSVTAVLAGAGLWPADGSVPGDYGVIQYLAGAGLIARGPGRAPNSVNLYDRPGVHIFMSIDGRYFGTSDGGGGNRRGGPTWLDDGAPASSDPAYHRWHFPPGVLRNHVTYGHSYAFATSAHPELLYGAELGDTVHVAYRQSPTGSMGLAGLTYAGAQTITGTVTALAGSLLTVQTPDGQLHVLDVSLARDLLSGVVTGAGVTVTYSRDAAGRLVPHALQVTTPAPTPVPTAPAPTPPVPSSAAPGGTVATQAPVR